MLSPYGNEAINGTTPWHPEPQTRGTFSIVSSCLITTSLCIWTAVHLNIPSFGKSNDQIWRKIGWLVAGLFAPEFVAWTAFYQYRRARLMLDVAQKAFGQCPHQSRTTRLCNRLFCRGSIKGDESRDASAVFTAGPESGVAHGDRHIWTLTHGFFVIMGGFAVEASENDQDFILQGRKRMTLSEKGFRLFCALRSEVIPDISEKEIQDKSKANSLAKTVVCVQAAWFCAQCIVRLAQGLSISLLELNTFAHAVCTFLVYFLWWNKPLDVEEPALIRGKRAHPTMALATVLSSSFRALFHFPLEYIEKGQKYIPSNALVMFSPGYVFYAIPSSVTSAQKMQWQGEYPVGPMRHRVYMGEELYGFRSLDQIMFKDLRPVNESTRKSLPRIAWSERSGFADLSSDDARCIELAGSILNERTVLTFERGTYLVHRAANGPWKDVLWHMLNTFENKTIPVETLAFIIGATFAGFVYGALHATAWNAIFPTQSQKLLWKTSVVLLLSSGPGFVLLALPLSVIRRMIRKYGTEHIAYNIWFWSSYTLASIFALIYCAARIYLVVECFISLRYLQPSAFVVASWSQYVPHVV